MSWSAKMAKFQLQYLSVGNGNTVFVVEVVFQWISLMTVSPKYSVSVVYKNIYLTSTCFEIGQDLIELQHNIDFHVCIDHRQGVVLMYT